MADKKPKKKFKETAVGKFLLQKIPTAVGALGDALPNAGVFGVVKSLIATSEELTAADKAMAMELLAVDIQEMESVTRRWESDMTSDSMLSKNVRPMTLIYLTIVASLLIVADSIGWDFNVEPIWVDLLKTLLVSVYLAYFGSRGYEKYTQIRKEK